MWLEKVLNSCIRTRINAKKVETLRASKHMPAKGLRYPQARAREASPKAIIPAKLPVGFALSHRPKTKSSASVDLERVQKLAELARLSVSPQEAGRLGKELSSILDYFDALDKVDVSKLGVFQAGEGGGQREDEPRPSSPDEILAGVPQKRGRYVRAPRVF